MNKKTEFFKSFQFDQLYTQDQIGKRFGKNRHYVSTIFTKLNVEQDDQKGLTKYYWGATVQRLTDEGAFDKYLAESKPMTPKPLAPYAPKNFQLV